MRRFAFVVLLAVAATLTVSAAEVKPYPVFVGTWLISQGSMMPDGTAIPLDQFAIPELMHVDLNNEVRAFSGLFHPTSAGNEWSVCGERCLKVNVTATTGIGDWGFGPEGEIVLSYHAFLYAANKPIGYLHVLRTIEQTLREPRPPFTPSPELPSRLPEGSVSGVQDVLSGMAYLRFFDLTGQPLALPLVKDGEPIYGLAGPYRAVRAAVGALPE